MNSITWKFGIFNNIECSICLNNRKKFIYHPTITSTGVVSDEIVHQICLKCAKQAFLYLGRGDFRCHDCRGSFLIEDSHVKWNLSPRLWGILSVEDFSGALNFLFNKKKITQLRKVLFFLQKNGLTDIAHNPTIQGDVNCITRLSGSFGYLLVLKTILLPSFFIISHESLGICLKNASLKGRTSCVSFLCKSFYIRLLYLNDALNCAQNQKIASCITGKIRRTISNNLVSR